MFLPTLSVSAIGAGAAFAAGARSGRGGMRGFPLQTQHAAARLEYFREPLPQRFRERVPARARDSLEIVQRTQNVGALPCRQCHMVWAGILSGRVIV